VATIVYRVRGRDTEGCRVVQRFRSTDAGRKEARALVARLDGGSVLYDVRTRIAGRQVSKTFTRRRDADAWIASTEGDRMRGVAVDPRRGSVTVEDYARAWLAGRHDLAERTAELYAYLLDHYVLPDLGTLSLAGLRPDEVRSWHARHAKDHPTTAAKAYRLLSTITRHAVADEVIGRNPCQVKGASVERAPERPMASVAEVAALAEAMPDHLRVLVLLAAWCQLRRGELLGLRRQDVDLEGRTITVDVTRTPKMVGGMVTKAPKTAAGRRAVSIPGNVLPALRDHLVTHVGPEPDALVAVGEKGGPVTAPVLQTAWNRARREVGRPDLRLHDLRHSGLTWSAATGASVAELMRRAGHASAAAALRYQHATEDRDRALADALAGLATASGKG